MNTKARCTTKASRSIPMKTRASFACVTRTGLESTVPAAGNMTACWREIPESSNKDAFRFTMKRPVAPSITTAVNDQLVFFIKMVLWQREENVSNILNDRFANIAHYRQIAEPRVNPIIDLHKFPVVEHIPVRQDSDLIFNLIVH